MITVLNLGRFAEELGEVHSFFCTETVAKNKGLGFREDDGWWGSWWPHILNSTVVSCKDILGHLFCLG